MKRLRIGIIGTGRWGSNILRTLEGLTACEVAFAVGRDFTEALQTHDVDAVAIATPASTHLAVAKACLKRGLPIFVEKPLATSLKDALAIAAMAKEYDTAVFVGHIHLYNPAYLAMKKKAAKVGKIRRVLAEAGGPGPVREDANVLWDWTPHDVALLLDLFGRAPTKVDARGDDDAVSLCLRFPGGAEAFIYNARTMPEKVRRVTVVGETGSVAFDDFLPKLPGAIPPLTAELKAWLGSLRGKKIPTDLEEGLAVVNVLDTADRLINASHA